MAFEFLKNKIENFKKAQHEASIARAQERAASKVIEQKQRAAYLKAREKQAVRYAERRAEHEYNEKFNTYKKQGPGGLQGFANSLNSAFGGSLLGGNGGLGGGHGGSQSGGFSPVYGSYAAPGKRYHYAPVKKKRHHAPRRRRVYEQEREYSPMGL